MPKVALVTDSTAYIPPELSQGYPVYSVPLQLIWGQETFRDGIDIQPDEFYARLKNAKIMPTTSQPSPAAFIEVYKDLLEKGYDILSVHISAKLSGTYASAIQAKEAFPGERIQVINSVTTSMAMGYPVLMAAKAATQGATLEECSQLVEKGCANTGLLFAVNTLEFLRRGGRIGGAAAFLGTALNLKPILELCKGHVEAKERVRTMGRAIDRLLNLVEEEIAGREPLYIACVHALAKDEADLLLERARQRFGSNRVVEAVTTPVSPVIGTHTGPGCLGLTFLAGM